MDSEKVESLTESIEIELKSRLNKEANNYGCEIDDINVSFLDEKELDKMEKINEMSENLSSEEVEKNKMKSYSIYFLEVILILLTYIGIIMLSKNIYISTGNLLFYLIYMHFLSINKLWIIFWIIHRFIFVAKIEKIKNKFFVYAIVISLSWLCMDLMNLNVYSFLYQSTNIITYKFQIVEDAIKGETTNIETNFNFYSVHSSGMFYHASRRRHKLDMYFSPGEISFYDNNGKAIYLEAYDELVEIVQKLQKINPRVSIEYYNNSGIIKSIEGIDIFNYDELSKMVEKLENKYQEEIDLKKLEEEKEQQKQREKEKEEKAKKDLETAVYRVKSNSIGRNIEDVKEDIEQLGSTDYTIKYVGTKFYTIGTVAFVERINGGAFYVVENNDNEDMTEMPELKQGMSKDDVIRLLAEKELKCHFYNATHTSYKDKINTLCSYEYSPGTLLPKGLEVGIGIYVYDNTIR